MKLKNKKNLFISSLLFVSSSTLGIALISSSCQSKENEIETLEKKQSERDISVDRDNALIGERLVQKVEEVIKNAKLSFNEVGLREFLEQEDDISKDRYISDLWEKITVWLSEHKGLNDRYHFFPEDLKNEELVKYLNIYIPNLEYFAGNHEVHCYFGYDSETRNIYYYFKIKCLDGKQTEGDGTVYLTLPTK
ncbi:hypothetical protein [Metamycoplasma gateae]|uniref:Lipoprotein n=1 Tax=Metamycoplasma gateae TaxID=35769 RepID=A0ABZ2AKS2_9BACT|nr:hypothetical protein V2E26_02810 [Metamycoplasma gateae]